MPYRRRLLVLLAAAALLGLPAGVLRAACVGNSCLEPAGTAVALPFCSLPADLKDDLVAGFRDGRSPVILAVAAGPEVRGTAGPGRSPDVPWPSERGSDARVPIAFAGEGVSAGASLPDGVGLRQVAPTLAEILGLRRPHPEVRSGEAIEGVAAGGPPRLALLVALKGIGTGELEAAEGAWPRLRALMDEGPSTLEGVAGSLPLDPAATLATIGTGALPSEHGIVGTYLRNDRARLVRAWGRGAPLTIVSTLGDDLDQDTRERSLIGLVADDEADRGLVGGTWYLDHDRDDEAIVRPGRLVASVRDMLARGYGDDGEADLLAVVLRGPLRRVDAALDRIVRLAERAANGSLAVAVAGAGGRAATSVDEERSATAAAIAAEVEDALAVPGVIEAASAGGLFLDQEVTAREGIPSDRVVRALLDQRAADGSARFADAFPAFAVSFARYC